MVKTELESQAREPLPTVGLMLPRKVTELPKDLKGWNIEPKLDGVRVLVYVDNISGSVRIQTKTGRNIASNFPQFERGFAAFGERHSAILDGELIYADGRRGTGVQATARTNSNPPKFESAQASEEYSIVLFDIMYLDGRDLRGDQFRGRRRVLTGLFSGSFQERHKIRVISSFSSHHEAVHDRAKAEGVEGVVVKRRDSRYTSGLSSNWRKLRFK